MADVPYEFSQYVPPLETRYDPYDRELTSMRIHELALQRWFNANFTIMGGQYPTPVIFAMPRDAFGEFTKLWTNATNPKNPFNYLIQAGYEPYPANIRYPLISVTRSGETPRPQQSYGTHMYRRIMWPTVSADVVRQQLGNVAQARMPQAWNFRFQIDHFCTKPETHAYFRGKLRRALPFMGGSPQAFIVARYPGYYGPQFLRLYLEGAVEDTSGTEFDDRAVEYRTTVNLVLEGYEVFYDMRYMPALWHFVLGFDPVAPSQLNRMFEVNEITKEWDLREDGGDNPVVDSHVPPLPLPGTLAGTDYDQGTV